MWKDPEQLDRYRESISLLDDIVVAVGRDIDLSLAQEDRTGDEPGRLVGKVESDARLNRLFFTARGKVELQDEVGSGGKLPDLIFIVGVRNLTWQPANQLVTSDVRSRSETQDSRRALRRNLAQGLPHPSVAIGQ